MLARRSFIQRRKPLAKMRPTERIKDRGRVAQRMARKASAAPTAEERRHWSRVSEMGCLVCGRPATIHHVTSDGHKRIARSHRRVVPLCPVHHQIQHGPRESVEALGHAGFTATYGIDLLAVADRLWETRDGA